jgi:hypothetical protein
MYSLHPTPTRLAALRFVAAGEIWTVTGTEVIRTEYGQGLAVTDRVHEMWHAGWVEPVVGPIGELWNVTDAGRQVLAEADGGGA